MPPAPHGRGNHGSGSARRKRHAPGGHGEEGGAERWLVTYADMLTLLLVLFIVLFSVSVVNTSKFISLKTSLAAVFGNGQPGIAGGGPGVANQANGIDAQVQVPDVPSANKKGAVSSNSAAARALQQKADAQKADFARIRAALEKALKRAGLQDAVRFAVTSRGLVITVVTDALVVPGNSATLLPRGQQILSIVAPPLQTETRDIEVDGHTNQLNVSTGPYPSGWELSSARASTVVSYLVAHGVSPKQLSAVGWSDQHPLYPPSDPRSVTLNRRVEIVVLSSLTAKP